MESPIAGLVGAVACCILSLATPHHHIPGRCLCLPPVRMHGSVVSSEITSIISQYELVSADARVSAAPMVLKRGMAVNTEQPMTADITKVFLDLGLRGQVGSIKQQKGCYCPPLSLCYCPPLSNFIVLHANHSSNHTNESHDCTALDSLEWPMCCVLW